MANDQSPLDDPHAIDPHNRPEGVFTPPPPAGPPPAAYVPLPASTNPHPGDPGTITVTATATMPQPAVPEVRAQDMDTDIVVGEPPKDAKGWALVRFYLWKYVGTLVMEQHGGQYVTGLGRLAFVAVFVLALYAWGHGRDIPEGAQEMLYVLLGYILGNRGLVLVQQLITAKHGDPYARAKQP